MIRLAPLALVAVGVLAGTAAGAPNPGAARLVGPTTLAGPGIFVGALKSSVDSLRRAAGTKGDNQKNRKALHHWLRTSMGVPTPESKPSRVLYGPVRFWYGRAEVS